MIYNRLLIFILAISSISVHSQILIDEDYTDWEGKPLILDDLDDGNNFGVDFISMQVSNDEENIYFKIEIDDEILLQEENNVHLALDIDNTINTGEVIHGIGADIIFDFGDRTGRFIINGFNYTVYHDDLRLVVLPSLSSKIFELSIQRNIQRPTGGFVDLSDQITCVFYEDLTDGDYIPELDSEKTFEIDENLTLEPPTYQLSKQGNGFRLMTYNSLFDGLFDSPQDRPQERIIGAMNADIYAFVEIYDHNSSEIVSKVQNATGSSGFDHASEGFDTHLISKYAITNSTNIDGNGAYLLDYQGNDLLIIVAHLPAGSNDSSRQQEVDKIAAFVRDAKSGNNSFALDADAPIIITGDMNLYGDKRQRETLLTGDISNNNTYGPDAALDWDDSDLTACLAFATGTPHAITWLNNGSSFFPGRLDYTIYTDHVLTLKNTYALYTSHLSQSDLNSLGLFSDDTVDGSDHFPVIADFEIRDPTAHTQLTLDDLGVRVGPNPTVDFITIDSKIDNYRINVFNSSGISVYNNETLPKQIQTRDWPSDIYIVNISDEKGISASTLIYKK